MHARASGQWERHFSKGSLALPKGRTITLGIAAGILMTMVRGPWIGGFLASGITMIGRAKNRRTDVRLMRRRREMAFLLSPFWRAR